MKFGMNLFLWTDEPTGSAYLPLYESLKSMGFDGVELPVMGRVDPDAYRGTGERLESMGLERTCVTVCPRDADPISPDATIRKAAVLHLRQVVDACAASGSRILGGPLYAAIGEFSGAGPTSEEWKRSIDVIQEVADYAARQDVTLVLEFLNRFEIYLLNCAADTLRYVDEVGASNVGVHYDTFHAHIEEKSVAAAIGETGSAIRHVHVSENDRGTPGQGQVAWDETFDALAASGYDGWLTIEAFGGLVSSLAAATKIWRPMFESEEQLARDGLAFMKSQWSKRAG
jgi:D-psicose/D-tagatose/L-ribulose 3-epimerase